MIEAYYLLRLLPLIVSLFVTAKAQTWCGKHYTQTSPRIPPAGHFEFPPPRRRVPLLEFQCSPAEKPYLAGETPVLIVDSKITELWTIGPPVMSHDATIYVSVCFDGGESYDLGQIPINSTGTELPLPSLLPRKQPYTVTCAATVFDTTYTTHTHLHYLPLPLKGSVTKQDFRTGALLIKSTSGNWQPFFPVGFYTSFDGFLGLNVSNVDDIKSRGLNVVHPVPTFGNMTAFVQVLDRMEELGLWLIYDMRSTYQNLSSVTEQVNMLKSRSNLLLWYTADEPDGHGDLIDAPKDAYDHINDLDGYHPISLVLNCQDYCFKEYARGADIILHDTYPIGVNATYSRVWETECTPEFGDCGCDNCAGNLQDIPLRVDEFKQRLNLLGRGRSTAVWSVPQAFGNESYWPRYPTGREWLLESVLAINHGSLGIISWIDPTSPEILTASSALAAAITYMLPFLASPNVSFRGLTYGRIDVGLWMLAGRTLIVAANSELRASSVTLAGIRGRATQILNGGGEIERGNEGTILWLDAMGTSAWLLQEGSNFQLGATEQIVLIS